MSKKQSRCCQVVSEGADVVCHPETDTLRKAVAHAMPYHGGGVGYVYEFGDEVVLTELDLYGGVW